ncbi:YhhN family protein [Entamoeba marina]
MLSSIVLLSVLVDAVLCWVSYVKKITTMKVITKPSFCLILIVYLLMETEWNKQIIAFSIGLFFSFLGDLLLLMSGLQWFACGLMAFLVTHICNCYTYYTTLNSGLILAGYILLPIGSLTSVPLMQNSKVQNSKVFYIGCSCGFFAYLTLGSESGSNWNTLAAILTAVGYSFFICSDAVLAWDVFVDKTMASTMVIITTYHIAQVLLVFGLIVNQKQDEIMSILV